MRKLLIGLCLSLLIIPGKAQEIPAVYSNIGSNEKGIFLQLENKRIYAIPPNDMFRFSDLYSNVTGTQKGLDFDFKYPKLNGTLFYGFINYKDGSYPQPVYFRESAPIINGKTNIPIAARLSGRYDMIGWEKSGQGVLGYRIVTSEGTILYDGKAAFSHKDGMFTSAATLVEGPFINKLTHEDLVISFTTSKEVKAYIKINDKIYRDRRACLNHQIKINKLEAKTTYPYSLKVGKFNFNFKFETAPLSGSRQAFTFAYGSDSRAGQGGGERNIFGTNAYIMKRIASLAKAEGAKFVQFTGDLIDGYDVSRERMNLQYANWKHAVEPYWHYMPFYAGFGNHEAYSYLFNDTVANYSYMIDHFPFADDSGESLFQDNFVLPENGPQSEDGSIYDPNPSIMDFPSYKESVYWYSYDNVAMVVLNSDYFYAPQGLHYASGNLHAYIMDNQLKWLKKTLKQLEKNKTIDHVFISIHTPFFPNGGHVKDDMWYSGDNRYRAMVAGKSYIEGIIQRRDQLLDLIVNESSKTVAALTGDEHNYNMLTINEEMPRYPENYSYEKLNLKRTFYQINNGAAGAPYYAQEKTPWMMNLRNFSTQNAIVLIDVEGDKIKVRVKNPDTLELIDEYTLRE
ncbi:metallophosphoesterase [Ancylomarina sp.]|uniref:metallophosphoesterase family protein n=1 Tax=Ancylomarina sp. TaxID=1970196 RepID=UPI00356B0FD6